MSLNIGQVDMKWSPDGSALIVQTSTDVDTSGKSYYGETGLYFLQSDGGYDCIIPLTKEGTSVVSFQMVV